MNLTPDHGSGQRASMYGTALRGFRVTHPSGTL
jgi:hypothetical protein